MTEMNEEDYLNYPVHEVRADGKILILWPESQRIMEHPEAELDLTIPDEPSAYWVPPQVWGLYQHTYYGCYHELYVVAENQMGGLCACVSDGGYLQTYKTLEKAQEAAEEVIEDLNDSEAVNGILGTYDKDSWLGALITDTTIGDNIEAILLWSECPVCEQCIRDQEENAIEREEYLLNNPHQRWDT